MTKKTAKTSKKQAKSPKSTLFLNVAQSINGSGFLKYDWPRKFCVYRPDGGERVPAIRHPDDTIETCSYLTLASDILAMSMALPGFEFTWKDCKDCADYWLYGAPEIGNVQKLRWADDPGITIRRLPWVKENGPTPTWSKILSRMHNKEAFLCWIGSLLDEDSFNQQYVWLYGVGNDGKGAINRFLANVLGRAYASKQPPSQGDRFWAGGLIGARLVVFPDCNSQSFVSGGFFKSLTGNDPISVEEKYRPSFTVRLNAKYLFLSNEKPKISSEKADLRRIIYCPMEPRQDDDYDPSFEARLWEEGGKFLSNCLDLFRSKCKVGAPIPQNDKAFLEDWVSSVEEDYEQFLESNYTVKEFSGPFLDAPFTPAKMVWEQLSFRYPKKDERLQFLMWLERKYGVSKRTVSVGDTTERRYLGLVPK